MSAPPWRRAHGGIRHRTETLSARRLSCSRLTGSATMSSQPASIHRARSSASGATGSPKNDSLALRKRLEAGGQPAFPPCVVVAVKRLACELPSRSDVPLARFTIAELRQEVLDRGIVAQISGVTVWRWLHADALQPWRHRSWIFPRDPQFSAKAGRILDLYAKTWDGAPLGPDEFVISADEKPSIQARRRKHPTLAPGPARAMRVEHEYGRTGALTYLAAWDVHRATLFGRCEPRTTIAAVDRLVEQVMTVESYRSARRVFWIADNCSSHRGERAARPPPGALARGDLGPYAQSCELAQPSGDLLLGRPAEGRHTQRLRLARRPGGATARVPGALCTDGATLSVDVHAERLGRAASEAQSQRIVLRRLID